MKKLLLHSLGISSLFFFSCVNNNQVSQQNNKISDSAKSVSDTSAAFGIDIAKYQGNLIQDIGPEDGLDFIFCKATEGLTYTDPDFETNWNGIRSKGLIRGSYHFYRSNDDPAGQAQFFVGTLHGLDSNDLPPVLDIEDGSIVGKTDTAGLQKDLLTFLAEVERLCSRKPIIYTGLNFANNYLNNSAFSSYHIWLAEYENRNAPKIPKTWQQRSYLIWQKSDSYHVDSDTTDFDLFNGNKAELLDFIRSTKNNI